MSNQTAPCEQDIEWLLERMPDASESYQDDFAELVSHHVKMDGKSDQEGRELALARLQQRRWGSG